MQVSFKDEEEILRLKIKSRSKYLGDSGWMKQAAAEKIEREENQEIALMDRLINGN